MALYQRSRIRHGGCRPTVLLSAEPYIDQHRERRRCSDRPSCRSYGNELTQSTRCVTPTSPHRSTDVPLTSRPSIDARIGTQLPRTRRPLTHRPGWLNRPRALPHTNSSGLLGWGLTETMGRNHGQGVKSRYVGDTSCSVPTRHSFGGLLGSVGSSGANSTRAVRNPALRENRRGDQRKDQSDAHGHSVPRRTNT